MVSVLLFLACSTETPAPAPAPVPEPTKQEEPKPEAKPKGTALFQPLPADMYKGAKPSAEMIDLGRMLYYETRLSKNHDLSCNSCHMLDKFGVDNEPTSPGHKGARGDRNSPTTYNAALHFTQFWDGREPDVEAQAKGPILNPIEMGMANSTGVEKILRSIPGYQEAFKAAFPGEEKPITYDNMAKAIGAFERGLVTPGPFDAYLAGDVSALNAEQTKGYELFMETGCTACHLGPALGGSMYQKLGLVKPYPTEDLGRMAVTKKEADKHMFKVPSLRNITKTGPYLHDGSIKKLEKTVQIMAEYQLGKELSAEQVASIVAFLGALEGEIPTEYVKPPKLPESGPKTPKADPS